MNYSCNITFVCAHSIHAIHFCKGLIFSRSSWPNQSLRGHIAECQKFPGHFGTQKFPLVLHWGGGTSKLPFSRALPRNHISFLSREGKKAGKEACILLWGGPDKPVPKISWKVHSRKRTKIQGKTDGDLILNGEKKVGEDIQFFPSSCTKKSRRSWRFVGQKDGCYRQGDHTSCQSRYAKFWPHSLLSHWSCHIYSSVS